MLFITQEGKTVTVDDELKVNGPEPLKSVIKNEITNIDPEGNHALNRLAYLFYELQKRNFDVQPQEGDLTDEDFPAGATA